MTKYVIFKKITDKVVEIILAENRREARRLVERIGVESCSVLTLAEWKAARRRAKILTFGLRVI